MSGNPAIICLRCEVQQMVIETGKSSIDAFKKLPRGAQLLVAYCLYNKMWEVQLMEQDPDAQALVGIGWIIGRRRGNEKIMGCKSFEFTDAGADAVEGMREDVLASVREEELENYKQRKGKLYPWLW